MCLLFLSLFAEVGHVVFHHYTRTDAERGGLSLSLCHRYLSSYLCVCVCGWCVIIHVAPELRGRRDRARPIRDKAPPYFLPPHVFPFFFFYILNKNVWHWRMRFGEHTTTTATSSRPPILSLCIIDGLSTPAVIVSPSKKVGNQFSSSSSSIRQARVPTVFFFFTPRWVSSFIGNGVRWDN